MARTVKSARAALRALPGRIGLALVLCGAIVAAGVVAANRYIDNEVDKIPRVSVTTAPVTGNGVNYLIIGSDSRAFVGDSQDLQAYGSAQSNGPPRSDTLMVLHADGDHSYAVSFPRDLWVDIPGRGMAKINAAFNDGPQKVVDTLSTDFNVPINHYLEVDFKTFQTVVDAIGGINVYVPYQSRDANTGFATASGGCFTLNGGQALAYVRSRSGDTDQYYQYFINGKWVQADGIPDIGRIQRQQAFVKKLGRIAVQRMLDDPMKAPDLVNSVIPNLTADKGFDRGALDQLLQTFLALSRGDGGGLEFATLPWVGGRSPDGQDILKVKEPDADAVLARLRGETSVTPPTTTLPSAGASGATTPASAIRPVDVLVKVLNASGVQGAAATAESDFDKLGFVNDGIGNDPRGIIARSEVRYRPGNEAGAQLVASHVADAQLVADSTLTGSTVVVALGKSFQGVTTAAAPTTTTVPAAAAEAAAEAACQ
jgi:LCP family protein required for cell wall assembly